MTDHANQNTGGTGKGVQPQPTVRKFANSPIPAAISPVFGGAKVTSSKGNAGNRAARPDTDGQRRGSVKIGKRSMP